MSSSLWTPETLRGIDIVSLEPSVVRGLGPPGTFNEAIIFDLFSNTLLSNGKSVPIILHENFAKTAQELHYDPRAIAVFPFTNSSTSPVHEVTNMLLDPNLPLDVVATATKIVKFVLAALPGVTFEEIKSVLSHPKGIGQTSTYTLAHGFETHVTDSTSAAAMQVRDSKVRSIAALCSERAAALYGLEVVSGKDEILENFSSRNATRFLIAMASRQNNRTPFSTSATRINYWPSHHNIAMMHVTPFSSNRDGQHYSLLSYFEASGLRMDVHAHTYHGGYDDGHRTYLTEVSDKDATVSSVLRSNEFKNFRDHAQVKVIGTYATGLEY